ncbi:RNA-guided endonuclease InsQ/TnpB family protein [Streptomyces sp. NPDC020490]|uniref:RNA-guided endonuclease InsQ/TnpB family protein n=1 Tax=Streptomyces sp. NPDC020490 TaxID=3365078 RepID=UPI00379330E1
MKLVVQVKLMPTPAQATALDATLRACNEAASWVAEVAFAARDFRIFALRKRCYAEVRHRWRLGAQAAQHVVKKTADAYTVMRATVNAPASVKRSRKHRDVSRPVAFRPQSAQPYDDRMLSWQTASRTVALWTVEGRLKQVAFTGSPRQLDMLARYRRGESDLVKRDGAFFLHAVCEVPEAALNTGPVDFLGVDLGIVDIATTSDGEIMSGRQLNRCRVRDRALRSKLHGKKTKSAKRRARRRCRKEARRTRDINHKIAKRIVAEAERTGRGVGLEDLTGIRGRVRLGKPQRATLHTWAFAQLRRFIAYKARLAGVPVVYVDPAYTSRTCAECGHLDKANRVSQAWFACRACGFVDRADRNASRNIRARAWMSWRRGARSAAPAVPEPGTAGRVRRITASGARDASPGRAGDGRLTCRPVDRYPVGLRGSPGDGRSDGHDC